MAKRQLFERDAQLRELTKRLATAAAGTGCSVLIEGEPGVGKSAMLAALIDEGRRRGAEVLFARGGELERDLGWGIVRELFQPPVRDEARRAGRRSRAMAEALEAIGRRSPAGVEPVALSEALYGLDLAVTELAARSPLLVAVDDVQWADRSSLEFLAYLALRVTSRPIVVCATVTTSEPAVRERLHLLDERSHRITLGPLGVAATTALLAVRLGVQPAAAFAAACHHATGGNPFLLDELATELLRQDIEPLDSESPSITDLRPEAIARFVLGRLMHLSSRTRAFANAVAVLGDAVRLDRAAALAGVDLDAATAATSQLVTLRILDNALPLMWRHAIVRSVVYETIPVAERAQMHAQAARLAQDAGDGADQVAAHMLRGIRRSDPEVVSFLRATAVQSLANGSPDSAVSYLRRALDEPPTPTIRPAVLIELGNAEAVAGVPTAIERLDEALAGLADPRDRGTVSLDLACMLHKAGRFDEASDVVDRARRDLGDADQDLVDELEAAFLAAASLAPDRAADARRRGDALVARLPDPPGPYQRTLLAHRAGQRAFDGDPSEGVCELARRLLAGGQLIRQEGVDSTNLWTAISCLVWSDELSEAEAMIDVALEDALRSNTRVLVAQAHHVRASARYLRGRIADAIDDSNLAIEAWKGGWGLYLPSATHWSALGLLETGDVLAAETVLGLVDEVHWQGTLPGVLWQMARGHVAAARGDVAAAFETYLRCGELAETLLVRNPAIVPWRSAAALAAGRIGRRNEAAELATEELTLARRFGAPRSVGTALRTAGSVAGPVAGLGMLREAVDVLERSPSHLEHARALVDLGCALRRLGRRTEAALRLRTGLDLADRFGASVLAERVRSELALIGVRPTRPRLTGPGSLTPGELRVCRMAAEGHTNRQIAEQLVLSLRTVETHLTHAYQKLDVTSRAEMALALAAANAPAEVRPSLRIA